MTDRKVTAIQLNIWLISAVIGPMVFYADASLDGIVLWSGVISALCWCAVRYGSHWDGVIYNIVQCLWLSVVLSQLLPYSADCWPTGEQTFPVVPLTLLALATVSALKDSKCTAGGISVLFWVLAFLLGIVFVAGVPELNGTYMASKEEAIDGSMIFVFLLPAAAGFLNREKTGKLAFLVIAILGAAIPLWICGILSPQIASNAQWPFYEAAKSVQLFAVAKRLEPLVSAGITVGNYALYSLLLCCLRNIGDKFQKGREAVFLGAGLSGSLMLLNVTIDPLYSAIICAILWIFLPLLGVLKKKQNE